MAMTRYLRQVKQALNDLRAQPVKDSVGVQSVQSPDAAKECTLSATSPEAKVSALINAWQADPDPDEAARGRGLVQTAEVLDSELNDDVLHNLDAAGLRSSAVTVDAPPPEWAGKRMPIDDMPAFRARYGLRVVRAEWRRGEPCPAVYFEPVVANRSSSQAERQEQTMTTDHSIAGANQAEAQRWYKRPQR